MTDIATLNAKFGIAGQVTFKQGQGGLDVVEVSNEHSSASILLQGAHLMTWAPKGEKPVIWMSRDAKYVPGKSVRGGVPVCWPWFGALPGKTAHGFVRTRLWQVRETGFDNAGRVVLRLGLSDDADTRTLWPHGFDLELRVAVGATLDMELTTRNTGNADLTLTQALHSYFCVGDIRRVSVRGLEACDYLDKVQNFAPRRQQGVVRFEGETDRVYFGTSADCLIDDPAWSRSIRVAKRGSTSTVVWNPWVEREAMLTDMVGGAYQTMVCVETTNAGPDQITLAAGQQHSLCASISVA